jgi:hypothetical protein
MNRTVSSNRAGGESFEGLLERLTRGAGSGDAQANVDSSFVSGSNAGAASLPGTRRRTLAPVAEAKSGGSKADSMPLSYEKALRLHARRNLVADTDLRNSVEVDGSPTRRTSPAANQAINQVLIQDQEMASAKRRARRPQAASSGARSQVDASTPAKLPHGSKPAGRKNSSGHAEAQFAAQSSARSLTRSGATLASAARSPAKAAKVHKTLSHGKSSKNARAATELRAQSAHLSHATPAKTADPLPEPGRQLARRDTTQPEELRLELPHTNLQLEHRHAVVSIRLNDSEIERLRQRAAESGISVSAYMRSCVLEAEHLRAQVKQALAEMRASIQPIALPNNPTGPTPLPSRLAMLSGSDIGAGGGGAWSRLLWKSATFLLGPWFFFRHRA